MICSHCGHIGIKNDFTNENISGSGDVGRCKKCRASIDAEYRKKKEKTALNYFELTPDLLERNERPEIGVLMLSKIVDRKFGKKKHYQDKSFGLDAVLSELKYAYEFCQPELINQYNKILISITSVMDIENLIYTFEKYVPEDIKPEIIVGGFGVININLITKYIDVAVFGRAEGQINEIINGYSFANVWRKAADPDLKKMYEVRQPQYLLKGEDSVGCHNRCLYCQYSYTRKSIGKPSKYSPGKGIDIQETDWHSLDVNKKGKYITALDGWSEATRLRVNKRITDMDIKDKLILIGNDKRIDGAVSLKIFQIVGYPHETEESVLSDIDAMAAMLAIIDKKITNNINLAFLCTPFGPEPLTPMEKEPADINTNWHGLLSGIKIYYGKNIKAFIITAVSGAYSLLKRVFINRAKPGHLDIFKAIAFSKRFKRLPERHKIRWLSEHNIINFNLFGRLKESAVGYLVVGTEGRSYP